MNLNTAACSLVFLFAAATASAQPDADNRAANWECANDLISKNYSQPYTARELGLRIADECKVPYREAEFRDSAVVVRQIDRMTYDTQAQTFALQVEVEINRKRREEAIPLRR